MYPVDCVKTRLQCLVRPTSGGPTGLVEGLFQLVQREGIKGSFRGIGAVVCGAGPAHAFYFGIYEQMKKMFQSTTLLSGESQAPITHALSGVCATLAHDSIMTPADGEFPADMNFATLNVTP